MLLSDPIEKRRKTLSDSNARLSSGFPDGRPGEPEPILSDGRLTSRWIGPGMLGEFVVNVVCSGWFGAGW